MVFSWILRHPWTCVATLGVLAAAFVAVFLLTTTLFDPDGLADPEVRKANREYREKKLPNQFGTAEPTPPAKERTPLVGKVSAEKGTPPAADR